MDNLMAQYKATAMFLAEALPDTWKVLLFDLSEKKLPIVIQYRATKKQVDVLRRYLQKAMKSSRAMENGMLTNRGDLDMNEHISKMSVQFLRDSDGKAVGALVLYIDLVPFLAAGSYLESLLKLNLTNLDEAQPAPAEGVTAEPTLDLIDKMVYDFTDAPDRLTPDEKMELIIDLYDSGVLDLKGSVAKTAEALRMSEQSIYRYIAKLRRARGE